MRFLINSVSVNGIKGISKEITFSFTNKSVEAKDFDDSFVKAIYGCNGAGKSALVHAFDAYKTMIIFDYPLKNPLFAASFAELINKKSKVFSFNVFFSGLEQGGIVRYSHSLEVGFDEAGFLSLKGEKISSVNSRGEEKAVLFESKDGAISRTLLGSGITKDAIPAYLRENSIVRHFFGKTLNPKETGAPALGAILLFASSLQIRFGSNEDAHFFADLAAFLDEDWSKNPNVMKSARLTLQKAPAILSRARGKNYLWVALTQFENDLKKLEPRLDSFLRLLKPSIARIKLVFRREDGFSYCTPVFYYDGYSVDYEFESTGVKKICSLFATLYSITNNSIAIIDEADAGIHDIFFQKLIEYFATYRSGQLIITTHNIGLMESIKKLRRSVDILTDEGNVVSWTSKGASSPSLFYRHGALGGVPFNLQSFDFNQIFGEE